MYTSASGVGDGIDNDCDGLIDEEACWDSNTDDDGDSRQDEDCATPPPVDGQWADWAQWTACSVTCFSTTGASNNGSRSRERTCTNPAPAYDGKQCVGDPTEVEACSITNVFCPVDGAWTSWEIGAVAPLLVEADLSHAHARALIPPLNMAEQTVLGTQASSNRDVTHRCVPPPA